jgi:hypothetical protein
VRPRAAAGRQRHGDECAHENKRGGEDGTAGT